MDVETPKSRKEKKGGKKKNVYSQKHIRNLERLMEKR